ncbi:hypothetical protein K2173_009041 [Erythroxylum novogranatense]|uniref:Pentatricopeptide repeat-containing protein n=1 Tax=Erythroxylum novogranatense TaxID=1862640 RepID=A0AAV8TV49_9ROSI|nr:hypothetical protein K2173_009041 [Erythroxylum novogranatense]
MASSFIFKKDHALLCLISQSLFPKSISTQTTTPFPSFRALKSAIRSESNPEKLAEIFRQSAHYPTFLRHRPIFHLSIRKLARANRADLVDGLLQSLQKDCPFVKSEGFWIRLVMLYSSTGMVDQAAQTLTRYSQMNLFDMSEKSLCAILSAYINNGMFDKVHQLFDTMPKTLGVVPGVVSNNLVLKAFVKEKKIECARGWIEKMEKDGSVLPNIDSYNILLGAYLKNGNKNEFDAVVKKVSNKGMESNLTTYNFRILRLCKDKECVRAKKLLDEMVSKGLKPNSATYNYIIDGFSSLGDFASAMKVVERMVSEGYASPCSFTYNTLLWSMVKEGEFGLALDVSKEIVRRKWVPPFGAMEGLVRGLVEMSRVEEAKEVVEKMKKMLRGDAIQSWDKIEVALRL